MADFDRDSMMEVFTFEMSQLLEQLEQVLISNETGYTMDGINEIFRIMHTIKGSAAMMEFDTISTTAHSIEDLFFFIREENPSNLNTSVLTDYVLEAMDFIKGELNKIESNLPANGNGEPIIKKMKNFLAQLKEKKAVKTTVAPSLKPEVSTHDPVEVKAEPDRTERSVTQANSDKSLHIYTARVFFEDGCEMENIRAYTLVHNLGDTVTNVSHVPSDVIDEEAVTEIRKNGFLLFFSSEKPYNEIYDMLMQTVYLRELTLEENKAVQKNEKKINHYYAHITFTTDVSVMNKVAFNIVKLLDTRVDRMTYYPKDFTDAASNDFISKNGFKMCISGTLEYSEVKNLLTSSDSVKEARLDPILESEISTIENSYAVQEDSMIKNETFSIAAAIQPPAADGVAQSQVAKKSAAPALINVNVSKLDMLLNLMGELVIAEAMVTQNPELEGLELESFHKESRQLQKIINDVQNTVMSMRMVPLSTTFMKMVRLVRDMSKTLGKDVQLEIVGDDTEVDKNIIEHIGDPLMHIIRNSIDHGIEMPDVRVAHGKSEKGTVLLEAKNSGGDVLIIVHDDGAGLDREAILRKAEKNGLLKKPRNEYADKEVHQFIFMPGFSTNEAVTEYSGRGVGMDVVSNNLEMVGGSVLVDSVPGEGSTFTMKIPLTLAIIAGMTIKMGGSKYTIPIISIKESFKAEAKNVFRDPNDNEMITVRGEVYNVVRLHEFFNVQNAVTNIEDGIMIMIENADQMICLFADELVGEQQVVVKAIPKYIKKIRGISGCTLLGNGDISLIVDVAGFFDK